MQAAKGNPKTSMGSTSVIKALVASAFVLTCTGCGDRDRDKIAVPVVIGSSENTATPLEPFRLWLPRGLPKEPRLGSCALDRVGNANAGDAFALTAGESLLAEGWVADASRGALAKVAWLVLRGERGDFHVTAELGQRRPDVAAALGKRQLAESGYRVRATTQGLPAGKYLVAIHSADGNGLLICDTHRIAHILPP